jgi:hypothetical protein
MFERQIQIVAEEGDAVYIPARCWHTTESLKAGVGVIGDFLSLRRCASSENKNIWGCRAAEEFIVEGDCMLNGV